MKSREELDRSIRKRVEESIGAEARRAEINAQYDAVVKAAAEQRDGALKALDDEVDYLIRHAHTGGFTIGF